MFEVPDEHAGRRVRCQNCGTGLLIPGGPAQTTASPLAVANTIESLLDDWDRRPPPEPEEEESPTTAPIRPVRSSKPMTGLLNGLLIVFGITVTFVVLASVSDYLIDEWNRHRSSDERSLSVSEPGSSSGGSVRSPATFDGPSSRYAWDTVTCEDGGFAVSLPTARRTRRVERDLNIIDVIMDPEQCCMIVYYRVDAGDHDMRGGIEKHLDDYVEAGDDDGDRVYSSRITIEGRSGRDFAHDYRPKLFGATTRHYMRVYHVDGTVIAMSWKGPISEDNERDARHLFDSLELL